jgi:hypothetical protein
MSVTKFDKFELINEDDNYVEYFSKALLRTVNVGRQTLPKTSYES